MSLLLFYVCLITSKKMAMSRLSPHHKHNPSNTLLVLFSCIALLCLALLADFLWASSSSSSFFPSLSAVWTLRRQQVILLSNVSSSQQTLLPQSPPESSSEAEIVRVPDQLLSATFSDLPAPQLPWEPMPPAPVARLDGAAIQIDNLLYVFAGYGTIDYVHSHVDVFNFSDNTWGGRFSMPKEMGHSHLGMATDGRYIYIVSGQHGPQCRPPTSRTFILDTVTKRWDDMPSLPAPRYAPATQLWRGRLHVMGGSQINRHTPGLDHWSIAVKDGKVLEKDWRSEVPIPRGGPHRACVVVNDKVYVIGGQEGDFMAKPGSPIFKCSRRQEVVYGDVYMLDQDMEWKSLPSMPKPNSHIEFAWVVVNNSIIITGGTTQKHPVTKRMLLVGELFQLNLDTLKWSVIGKLPYRIKTTIAGYYDGWLYFTSGQRDRGPDNPQPNKVVGDMWRTKLRL